MRLNFSQIALLWALAFYYIYLLYYIYVQDVVLTISFYFKPSEVGLFKACSKGADKWISIAVASTGDAHCPSVMLMLFQSLWEKHWLLEVSSHVNCAHLKGITRQNVTSFISVSAPGWVFALKHLDRRGILRRRRCFSASPSYKIFPQAQHPERVFYSSAPR